MNYGFFIPCSIIGMSRRSQKKNFDALLVESLEHTTRPNSERRLRLFVLQLQAVNKKCSRRKSGDDTVMRRGNVSFILSSYTYRLGALTASGAVHSLRVFEPFETIFSTYVRTNVHKIPCLMIIEAQSRGKQIVIIRNAFPSIFVEIVVSGKCRKVEISIFRNIYCSKITAQTR